LETAIEEENALEVL